MTQKKTNVLDSDEAKVFFANFVATMQCNFPKYMRSRAGMLALMALGEGEHDDAAKAAMTKKVEDSLTPAIDALVAEYKGKVDEINAEAFKILDTNGNGTLELNEFLKLVQSESETKTNFCCCFRFRQGENRTKSPGAFQSIGSSGVFVPNYCSIGSDAK